MAGWRRCARLSARWRKVHTVRLNDAGSGLGRLDRAEKSRLAGTFLGWMLDGMDVMLFSFVMPTLIALWGISQGEAGLLGTTTLLFSAFGGWLAGLAADRWGRVRVLQVTILWFSLFTFLSGFTNSFAIGPFTVMT